MLSAVLLFTMVSLPPALHLLLVLRATGLLLLLLLLGCSTSISLAAGNAVSHLPGFHGPLPFHLEIGCKRCRYVGVDEQEDAQLFYYFVQSEGDPAGDPLLLWLTGGGCSGLSALAFEIGPFTFLKVRYNGSVPTLVPNPYSWTKVANIIFLDSPVGTGFSFARNLEDSMVGDMITSERVKTFIRKWLDEHPKFVSNPFYVAGDSYGGKLVPIVAHLISEDLKDGDKPFVNLKGYAIGNPRSGERTDMFSRIPFLHGMGIISDELYELTMKYCEGQDYRYPKTLKCARNLDVVENVSALLSPSITMLIFNHLSVQLLSEINTEHILEPLCASESPEPKGSSELRRSLQVGSRKDLVLSAVPDVECREYTYGLSYYWANNNLVREALQIQKGTVGEWQRCNRDIHYMEDIKSVVPYHFTLTSRGYRALVYSGDHDSVAPFVGTQQWIRSLNFSIVDDWRPWFVDGQVAGYTRSYSNSLTFATVKGAGHTAPEYRPKECLAMLQRWISYRPL